MSSKITPPPRGLTFCAPGSRPAAAGKNRGTKRQQSNLDGHADDEHLFGSDAREEAHPGQSGAAGGRKDAAGPPPGPGFGLVRPQVTRGGAAGRAQAVLGRNAKPEHSHWDRLIGQASPERLRDGLAALEQHSSALKDFARLVPSKAKGNEP